MQIGLYLTMLTHASEIFPDPDRKEEYFRFSLIRDFFAFMSVFALSRSVPGLLRSLAYRELAWGRVCVDTKRTVGLDKRLSFNIVIFMFYKFHSEFLVPIVHVKCGVLIRGVGEGE